MTGTRVESQNQLLRERLQTGFLGIIAFALLTGQIVAEQLLGLKTALPVELLDAGRFARGDLFVEPSVV